MVRCGGGEEKEGRGRGDSKRQAADHGETARVQGGAASEGAAAGAYHRPTPPTTTPGCLLSYQVHGHAALLHQVRYCRLAAATKFVPHLVCKSSRLKFALHLNEQSYAPLPVTHNDDGMHDFLEGHR